MDSSTSPGLIVDVVLATEEKIAERVDELKALYRAWSKAVAWQKENEAEADAIMAGGVGGWLEDADVFKETRAGVSYFDAEKNVAFIGTLEAPGAIVDTISNALTLGREAGLFDHELEPVSMIAFEIVK